MKTVCVTKRLTLPLVIVHGGAGAYLKTTTAVQRKTRGDRLLEVARIGIHVLQTQGCMEGVLAAVEAMELDPEFNAGYGSKLQQDGRIRVSAALMEGCRTRSSAVFNVQDCLHPSRLAACLQEQGDRNLDGHGSALLMEELGVQPADLRTQRTMERWESLVGSGDSMDPEAAIGDAGNPELELARRAHLPIPSDLAPLRTKASEPEDKYGTVGVVGVGVDGKIWACTSTGGRGHEVPGRISDSGMPAGNYACPQIGLSATGFGEQIIDLNLCGRIATRVLDGAELGAALERTFAEVVAFGGLLGVIAATSDGVAGYAHTTEACGIAWIDGAGHRHVDEHGR